MSIELERVDFRQENGQYQAQRSEVRGLSRVQVGEQAYLDRLAEINETFRIIEEPMSHQTFEIAVVNEAHSRNTVLFPSTHFSSLTQNPGNAIELAASGAANPNRARVYVAYHGNGGSSSLPFSNRIYLARQGRFTRDSYGLPGVQAMAEALIHAGLSPTHLSGDESGGRLGLGLMAAFGRDSIKDAYFNGIPGVSQNVKYVSAMLQEDATSRSQRRQQTSYVPGEIVPASIKEAKALTPNIYKGLGHLGLVASSYVRAPGNVLPNVKAFGRHDGLDAPATHAALQDVLTALRHQEAMITLQFNRQSSLHDIEECIAFGKAVMDHIPPLLRSERRGVQLLIGTGTLDAHTDLPAERISAERKSLSSIRSFMKLMLGDSSPIFLSSYAEPEVQSRAA